MADQTSSGIAGAAEKDDGVALTERVLQISNPVGLYSTLKAWQSQFVPRRYPGHQTRGPARPTAMGGRVIWSER